MVQKPPASYKGCGTSKGEGTIQAEDSSAGNSVRFQSVGTEGIWPQGRGSDIPKATQPTQSGLGMESCIPVGQSRDNHQEDPECDRERG